MSPLKQILCFVFLFSCILPCMTHTQTEKIFAALQNKMRSPVHHELLKIFRDVEGKNGDSTKAQCAICTGLVGLSLDYTNAHGDNIDDFIMHKFCTFFSGEFATVCKITVKLFGPGIINALTKTKSPDEACRYAKYCKTAECTLYPKKSELPEVRLSDNWRQYVQEALHPEDVSFNPFEWLVDFLKKITGTLTPLSDVDGDFYSANDAVSRGYHWRGRDCNDFDKNIHPGRKNDPHPGKAVDYNCNGIKGTDKTTKKDYKELLCANTNQMGVVVIGDSAGIFAQIPNEYVTAATWDNTTFSNLMPTVLDQGGHPQFSAYTGYTDEGYHGAVHSVYKNLVKRNKCNHRDYQNLAVSGASSGGTLANAKLLNRNPNTDHPLLVIMELAANDVCFGNGTPTANFKTNILGILDYLDTVLPAGSHLVSLGLVNGSMIHDIMGNNKHPMGMSYDVFYDYLNCQDIDLCSGYLTSNRTHIAKTTAHAMELNQVYKEIFASYKPKNYDILHYDFPAKWVLDKWKEMGGNPYELLSHVDGFHPSQAFNMLLGDYLWDNIMKDRPNWVGPVNPNNEQIEKLFGDQGGY